VAIGIRESARSRTQSGERESRALRGLLLIASVAVAATTAIATAIAATTTTAAPWTTTATAISPSAATAAILAGLGDIDGQGATIHLLVV
jgi:hypothetical protein